jgi:hypothetical protein
MVKAMNAAAQSHPSARCAPVKVAVPSAPDRLNGKLSLELRRLKDDRSFLGGIQQSVWGSSTSSTAAPAHGSACGGVGSTVGGREAPSEKREPGADSTETVRYGALVYDSFGLPQSAMLGPAARLKMRGGGRAHGAGGSAAAAVQRGSGLVACDRSGCDESESLSVLGYPLCRLELLVRVIYQHVSHRKCGVIDWEDVSSQMNVLRPGETETPPRMEADEAHRLWRLLAYHMAAPELIRGVETTSTAHAPKRRRRTGATSTGATSTTKASSEAAPTPVASQPPLLQPPLSHPLSNGAKGTGDNDGGDGEQEQEEEA